jgi:hypothetical protein
MARSKQYQVTPGLGAPTVDPLTGNPEDWVMGAATRALWGDVLVHVNGDDITEFRASGKRGAIPERWSYVKPHWYGDATIFVPKLRPYEALPSWCFEGAEVRLPRELPDTTISTDPRDEWRGYVLRISDRNGGTELQCQGLFQQPDLYRRLPSYEDTPFDVGTLWAFNLDTTNRPAYRWPSSPTAPTTGVTTRQRGDGETVLEYLTSIGALIPGWTWRPGADFVPELVDVTVTPGSNWTFRYADAEWLDADLIRDLRVAVNVIYAEGVVNGEPWLLIVPHDGATFTAPLSASKKVHTLFYNPATGGLTTDTSEFDPTVLRVEALWKLPPGMVYDEAFAIAEEFRARVETPGWTGRSTYGASPAEGHLLDMRPDDTNTLLGYRGSDPVLHVGEVEFNWNGGAPTADCALDTNARSLAMIEAILDGDIERATNPFAGLQIGKLSGLKKDESARWSNESGSGWGPNDATNGRRHKDGVSTFPVTGLQWNEYVFLASELGTIRWSKIVCSTDGSIGTPQGQRFVAVVTDRTVPMTGVLSPLPTNPMADGVWEDIDETLGFQMGWGGSFRDPTTGLYVPNAAGYGNVAWYMESRADPVTGLMLDTGTSWDYTHADASFAPGASSLVVYIFPCSAGSFRCWFHFVKAGA